jgi:hypothetical protein
MNSINVSHNIEISQWPKTRLKALCRGTKQERDVKSRFVVSPPYDLPVGKGQALNINRLDAFRNGEAGPIAAILIAQQPVGFRVANHLLGGGIEIERASQPVRHIGEVHQCG